MTSKRLYRNNIFLGVILLAFAILAVWIFTWSAKMDIGVTSDSIVYITGAKSLSAGAGFTSQGKLITHFPPGYAFILSLVFSLFSSPLDGIKYLNALLYALNTAAVGFLSYKLTDDSLFASAVSMMVFVSQKSILEIHLYAWSEAPFIFFTGTAFLFLWFYLQKSRTLFLFGSAVFLALSIFTRYVGFAIAAPICLLVLMKNRHLKKNLLQGLTYCIIAFGPICLWLLYNALITGSATNRAIAYHPVAANTILLNLLKTIAGYFLPIHANRRFIFFLLVVLGATFFAIHLYQLWKTRQSANNSIKNRQIIQTLIIFLSIFYLAFLLFSMFFIDVLVPVDSRLLAPLFFLWIIFVVTETYSLAQVAAWKRIWMIPVLLILPVTAIHFQNLSTYAGEFRLNGGGYTAPQWKSSSTITFLKGLPKGINIFTNGTDVVTFLTSVQTAPLPQKFSPFSLEKNSTFQQETDQLKEEIAAKRSIIVYFRDIRRANLLMQNDIETTLGIQPSLTLDDGLIYGTIPSP